MLASSSALALACALIVVAACGPGADGDDVGETTTEWQFLRQVKEIDAQGTVAGLGGNCVQWIPRGALSVRSVVADATWSGKVPLSLELGYYLVGSGRVTQFTVGPSPLRIELGELPLGEGDPPGFIYLGTPRDGVRWQEEIELTVSAEIASGDVELRPADCVVGGR